VNIGPLSEETLIMLLRQVVDGACSLKGFKTKVDMVRAEMRLTNEIGEMTGMSGHIADMWESNESYSQFIRTWVAQTYRMKASAPSPIALSRAVTAVLVAYERRQAELHSEEKVESKRLASGKVIPVC
jgi:hypothetical protein